MNEQDVRAWVAKRVHLPYIPDHLWNDLDPQERDNARGSAQARITLMRQAFSRLRTYKAHAMWMQSDETIGAGTNDNRDWDRARERRDGNRAVVRREDLIGSETQREQALSTLLAAEAAQDTAVINLRHEQLGKRVLNSTEVVKFMESPANRFLTGDQLFHRRISRTDHHSYLISYTASEGDEVTWLDEKAISTAAGRQSHRGVPTGIEHEVTVGIKGSDFEGTVSRSNYGKVRELRYVAPGVPGSEIAYTHQTVTIWPGSVLDNIAIVAGSIAETFGSSGWFFPHCFTFLITGWVPHMPTISCGVETYHRPNSSSGLIRMEILPWASSTEVLRTFRDAQASILKARNRPFTEKKLELVQFVASRIIRARLLDKDDPTWKELMDDWNSANGKWNYYDPGYMGNDYRRARRRILLFSQRHSEKILETP